VAKVGQLYAGVGKPANDFHVMWKGLCDFILVINSNVSRISHRFRDMANFPLKNSRFPTFSIQL